MCKSYRFQLVGLGWIVLLASACVFHPVLEANSDSVNPTAPVPTPGDAPAGRLSELTFEPQNIDDDQIPWPTGPLVVEAGTTTMDTSRAVLIAPDGGETELPYRLHEQANGPQIVVVGYDSLDVARGATLRVRGTLPLAIVTSGNIRIAGLLDASAEGESSGPGANVAGCGYGTDGSRQQTTTTRRIAGTGGGGGGYGGEGGDGASVATALGDAFGGLPTGTAEIVPLRGGCRGGVGGKGSFGISGGGAGEAGGGIQLIAAGELIVEASGMITVSGGGGSGATADNGGGGGGGSGGAVLLEAVSLDIAGTTTANGGAGGEGARNDEGGSQDQGANGADGAHDSDQPALAGSGQSNGGGAGGSGAAGESVAQAGLSGSAGSADEQPGGSGGGGGGVGRIFVKGHGAGVQFRGLVSPPAQTAE